MYVPPLKINENIVFFFSQHGIRAIEEFRNIRARVSSCSQFRRRSNDRVPLWSHYSRCKAEKEPRPPSEQPVIGNFFQRDFPTTPTLARGHSTRIVKACSPRQRKNLRQQLSHAPPRADLPSVVVPHPSKREGAWLLLRSPDIIT